MRKITIFILLFVVWILFVWPPEMQDVVAGLLAALVVTLVMRRVTECEFRLWLNPVRYFWLVIYLVVLAYYIIKANFDVAYRVLHPAMPIHPGIVKVKTSLTSLAAITVLSNSITLTPGTLTVNALENGVLYVHWINVKSTDIDEATKQIVSHFEWFLKRIFE